MPNPSFWENEVFYQQADFIIIGSGIVGLNAAIHLKESSPESRVVVLERGTLPIGASTRNAGFACFGSLSELLDDLKTQSEEEVLALVEKRWRGLQRLRERVGDKNLDFKQWGGYELFEEKEATAFNKCVERVDDFNEKLAVIISNKKTFQIADNELGRFNFKNIKHLIFNSAEGQVHTGKMMHALWQLAVKKGIEVFNGVEVLDFENSENGVTIFGNHGFEMKAAKMAVCTNGFAKKLLPLLKDISPARNQVLITKPIENLHLKGTFHYDRGYVYFRNVGNRVLLGGFRQLAKTEETTAQFGLTNNIQDALESFLRTVILPNQKVEIEQWWSGIMGVGETKAPIVKEVEKNVFVAVRLGGMGVAIGSLVGEEVAELMNG
ncbi:MAG: gamma-glutamylputrescine oxidase [Paraglaciecola sp.]|jgi:gamma-glutamylputrescine oxidase